MSRNPDASHCMRILLKRRVGTLLEEEELESSGGSHCMRILKKRMEGNTRRTYEGARSETIEGVRAAFNTQGYCWVVLSDHEDEPIHVAARNICPIYTDGSIDFHFLYCLAR